MGACSVKGPVDILLVQAEDRKSPPFPADPGQVPNAAPVGWLQCSPTVIPGSAGKLGSGPALSKPNSVA